MKKKIERKREFTQQKEKKKKKQKAKGCMCVGERERDGECVKKTHSLLREVHEAIFNEQVIHSFVKKTHSLLSIICSFIIVVVGLLV